MNLFYGFDLGDAESAISRLDSRENTPSILPIEGNKSFITAYAQDAEGHTLIGEKACYLPNAVTRNLRFKSRFLTDPACIPAVQIFSSGVLQRLYQEQYLQPGEDSCFYVGCPAGWDANTRELYREIFERAGYPPVKIISESRAALISACQSRHLQVGYDILSKSMLVVDIGSSTTDFAYVNNGRETAIQTAGEVRLGGGLMDEMLLEECIKRSSHEEKLREIFSQSSAWKHYCEFAVRRLKEKYFGDPAYWEKHECRETIMIYYDTPLPFQILINEETADHVLHTGMKALQGRSFKDAFLSSLSNVRTAVKECQPELIFLTGGVSKLPEIRSWCRDIFPEAIVITGTEPEFAVSRGLAWAGRIEDDLRAFRLELNDLIASTAVEEIVSRHIRDLYTSLVDALVKPIMENAAVPVFERWRQGNIQRLEDADHELETAVEVYLHSDDARALLSSLISGWLKPVADELEELTVPLCIRHHVPYTALSLNSYLSVSDLDFKIEAKDIFAVEQITWLIDSIITIIVGLLCGGSGIALISSGPAGIAAGAALSLLILIIGKQPMEKALLHTDLPKTIRRLIPRRAFKRRMDDICKNVSETFLSRLSDAENQQITEDMVTGISTGIEECLTHMAEIVEVPLG